MTQQTGVKFDRVDLTTIGDHGGAPKPLQEEIDELVQRASHDVSKPGMKGGATITVTIKVDSPDGGASFKVINDVKYTPPRRARSAMVAFHNPDGVMVTQDHRQMTMSNVTRMTAGDKDGDK